MNESVIIFINNQKITTSQGQTVAAAMLGAGLTVFRRSVTGEPRAPLCGMGICYECRVTINGQPHQRSCQIVCADGMRVSTDE